MMGVLIHVNGTPIELINIQCKECLDRAGDIGGKHLYKVLIGGKEFEVIHTRRDGYQPLLIKILKKIKEMEE